jgi:uncharacterized protein (UPF0332 family)
MKNKDKSIPDLMKKAKQSLNAAKDLLNKGYKDFSASRSYYAMFYAVEAVLLTKNLSFSTHKAVLSAFGKEFVKSGRMPAHLHRYILDAFDAREVGDYGPIDSVSEDESKVLAEQAEELIETIEDYLTKEGYSL